MALYRFTSHETLDSDGRPFLQIGPELEEERCDRCGGEAFPHLCFAEHEQGKYHHHGSVHDLKDGSWRLVPLCDDCHLDYALETIERKRSVREGVRS